MKPIYRTPFYIGQDVYHHQCENCVCDKKAFEEATCYEDYVMQKSKFENECKNKITAPKEPPKPIWHKPFA